MISSQIGKNILDGFCRCVESKTVIDFDIDNVYLGLLKVLPKNDETAYDDGTKFQEPSDPAYNRVQLNATHMLNEVPYISSALTEVVDGVLSAYVVNNAYIMFDETSADDSGEWGDIVGFGLFSEKSGTKPPYLWGAITTPDGSTVNIGKEEIPSIGKGNFKISLR